MKIDGECLKIINTLFFVDDVLKCVNTPHELQQMLQELDDESENQRLKRNNSMTTVMMENNTPIYINNITIENVESYIYLGYRYSTRDNVKTMRFNKSRPDGQHSPSTATSLIETLGHT